MRSPAVVSDVGAIYLLRHGKAAFGADDYDRLEPLGVEQAEHLGRALAAEGLRQPLVISGGMRRHQETLRAALGGGTAFEIDPRWDEFDHRQIIETAFPDCTDMTRLRSAVSSAPDPRAAFQQLFETAISRWTGGTHDADYAETWPAFRCRVGEALAAVARAVHRGRDAVVSTSGGPIAAAVQHVLGIADAQAVPLNWVIVNAGYTKLIAGRQLCLASFNVHAHLQLPARSLVTYR